MKYLLTISLLLFSLAGMAQSSNTAFGNNSLRSNSTGGPRVQLGFDSVLIKSKIRDSLHKYTDSFMLYKCRWKCALAAGKKDSVLWYEGVWQGFYHQAFEFYKQFNPAGKKTNVRFKDPDHYFKCSCQ